MSQLNSERGEDENELKVPKNKRPSATNNRSPVSNKVRNSNQSLGMFDRISIN